MRERALRGLVPVFYLRRAYVEAKRVAVAMAEAAGVRSLVRA